MWSWVLEGIGLVGATLVGKRIWWAWCILFANSILWAAYGLFSRQYGFTAFAVVYASIYARNCYQWFHQRKVEA